MPHGATAQVQATVDRGLDLAQRGSYDAAAAAFSDALIARPDIVDLHHNLGFVLLQLDRADEASSSFAAALARSPARANTHVLLGEARMALGDDDGARSSFSSALALEPRAGRAYTGLGELALRSGVAAAIGKLRLGASLAVDATDAARAWFLLGTAQRELGVGGATEAVASLRRAERLLPSGAD
eukprot:4565579-Prymnesium_polylepis.1